MYKNNKSGYTGIRDRPYENRFDIDYRKDGVRIKKSVSYGARSGRTREEAHEIARAIRLQGVQGDEVVIEMNKIPVKKRGETRGVWTLENKTND